ncbi:MAG: PKD domain-containing protein [Flavobacteriales bacterium]|nr:PKD domain-containing protein [Flavobacteriales bacterium]
MKKRGLLKHILLTGIFLLSLLSMSNISFGQCSPGSSGIADISASWTDSCYSGTGNTATVILTNNTATAGSGLVPGDKFVVHQVGVGDISSANLPIATPYSLPPYPITASNTTAQIDTFILYIVKGASPFDTCDADTVIVNHYPSNITANFTMSSSNVCEGDVVTFTSNHTGNGPLNYFWDFASTNGTSAAVGPHNITYNTASPLGFPYQIEHTVWNTCDTATVIQSLTVNPGAGGSMSFTIPKDTFCISECVQITNTSSANPAAYAFIMGDGSAPVNNATPPCYNYTSSGDYTIQLLDFSGSSCNGSYSQQVHIAPDITNLVISGDDGDGDTRNCLPWNDPTTTEIVNFTANANGAYYYEWDFGDGSPLITTTNNAIAHTYTSFGTFKVIVTAKNGGGCDVKDSLDVLFQRNPNADFDLPTGLYPGTPVPFYCMPYDMTPIDNSANGIYYLWDFGDGTVINTNGFVPTHTYSDPLQTTISITLDVGNECDTVSFGPENGQLITGPTANFVTDVPNFKGCVNQPIDFFSTSYSEAPDENLQWDFGTLQPGNVVQNQDTVTFTFLTVDTFLVQHIARVTGASACPDDTIEIPIVVLDTPIANFAINPNNGCVPTAATISNTSTGPELTFEWWVNGVLVSTDTLLDDSIFVPETNVYVIDLIAKNTCKSDTMTITFNYDPTTFAEFTPLNDTTICQGQSIQFQDQSTGIANTYSWDLNSDGVFGDAGGIPNPSHTFNTVGTFLIREIVQGCGKDTDSVMVTVLDIPNVNFSLNQTDICLGDTVIVTDNSTPTNATFQWYSSPAIEIGAADPKDHVFVIPGTNFIALSLVAGSCADTDSVFVEVRDLPNADIGLTNNAGCTPATFNFQNNSSQGAGIGYLWDFDNGNTSTANGLQTQTYINNSFTVDSNKTVSLIVTNQYGCMDTAFENITIHPTPDASFTLSSSSACANDPITFTNTSQPITSTFLWEFGDLNTSAQTSPTHQYANFGAYEVILTASNAYACVSKDTDSVFVDPAPVANFTFQDLCFGDSTLFTNTSTGNLDSAIWTFGYNNLKDTIDGGTGNTGHIYANTGNYNVTLEVINLIGCRDDITQPISVLAVPTADFSFANVICEQQSTAFSDLSGGHDPTLNYWEFGDSQSLTAPNPNHTYADTGFYDVLLVATNAVGCPDSVTKTIWVDSIPQNVDYNFNPVCIGDTTFFNNLSINGVDTVHWNFDDGTDTSTFDAGHVYNSAGPFDVILVTGYKNTGCVDSITYSIDAYQRITPQFISDTICFEETTNFTSTSLDTNNGPNIYTWYFGYNVAPVSNNINPGHQYPDSAGYYVVKLITENAFGCIDSVEDSIFVKPLPEIGFTTDTVCLGLSTQLIDTTDLAISWEWTFPDNSSQTNDTANFVFSNYGNHPVELVVENAYNCFDTLNGSAYVDSIPTPNFTSDTNCIFDTIFFTNLTPAGADTFYWDFGDGGIDSVLNPKYAYTAGGIYDVKLIAGFSGSSCFDSTTIQVIAHQRSFPGFVADTVCFKELTLFTDTTQFANIVDLYEWDFDDNTPINNNVHPQHQFPDSAGTYNVKLTTTTDSGCVDSIIVPITVNPLPDIGFTSDTVCPGLSTTLTDTTNDAQNWIWNFGDASPVSTGNKIENHIYPDSGKYYVQLIVFNSFNCRDTLNDSIYVHPRPTPGFWTDTACNSYVTNFTDTSIGAINFSWDFNDGPGSTSGIQNPTYTFTNSGLQNVQLLVENAEGCKDSITQTVLVFDQPLAGFVSSAVCAGNSSTFTDTTTNNPNFWLWDFQDGSPIDSNQHPTHVYANGGNVAIQLIAGDTTTGCFDTLNTTTVVNTIPIPDFTVDTACLGSITSFTSTSTDPFLTITQWDWDFGDNINTSTIEHPTYIYQDSGQFSVDLTVTNNGGCDSTITKDIYVKFSPKADFTFDTVCAGALTTFTDSSTGPPSSWDWYFGDGDSSQTGPITSHSYKQGGQYFVTLVVDLDGCTDQVSKVVDVLTGIVAEIDVDDTTCLNDLLFFGDSSQLFGSTVASHYWDFGDNTSSTSQHPKHAYTSPGVYQVILIDTTVQGCVGSDTQNVYVSELPVANFTTANPAACSDQITVFVDQSTTNPGQIVDWHWSFGDNNFDSSGVSSPAHQYQGAGNYTVELIAFNESGCSDTIDKVINVFDIPSADFNYTTSCIGSATPLQDNSSIGSGSIQGWEWTFPDGSSDNQSNSQFTFATNVDSAEVQLVVTSDQGCTDTVSKYVSFFPDVIFDFRAVNASGCQPYNASFEDNSYVPGNTGSNITNWLWDFGDGNFAFPENPNHVYEDAGDFPVVLTLTTSDGCSFTDTLGYDIYVHPKPISNFTCGPDSISVFQPVAEFTDLSEGGNTWIWNFGDGDSIVDILNPTHEYPEPGEYLVSYTVINNFNCTATTSKTLLVESGFDYHIPNAFTPNNDGKNDIFIGEGVGVADMRMFIFGRGGEIIFESYTVNVGWNGSVKDSKAKAKSDVYVYKIIITDIFGAEHVYHGHVTLIK